MGDEEDKKDVKEGGHINLKVVTQDGNEIFFKCKATTPLSKLMHAFCQRQGVALASVRFLFDGTRINEHQTPSDVRRFPQCPFAPSVRQSLARANCACGRCVLRMLSTLPPASRSSTWRTVRSFPARVACFLAILDTRVEYWK